MLDRIMVIVNTKLQKILLPDNKNEIDAGNPRDSGVYFFFRKLLGTFAKF